MEKKPCIDNGLPLISDETVSGQNGDVLHSTGELSCGAMLRRLCLGTAFSASDLGCENTNLSSCRMVF